MGPGRSDANQLVRRDPREQRRYLDSAAMTQTWWREALEQEGFAVVDGHDELEEISKSLGRSSPVEVLTARASGVGWSHSDVYGYQQFPWHTDGAVSLDPPRWVVLTAIAVREDTRTEVLRPGPALMKKLRSATLRVRDRRGAVRYLPAAVREAHGHRLRWDPRVALPTRSGLLADVENAAATAHISWTLGRSAIIDNHRILHRRPQVTAGIERTLTRYYIQDN